MVLDADPGNDEEADDDLEAPVDDVLRREDNHHEEHDEGQQDQELFLYVLQQLPQVVQPRIPCAEVRSDLLLVLPYSASVRKELVDLELHEYHHDE